MNSNNLYIKTDPHLDFHAIIALQGTQTGPAIGGCRCIEYTSAEEAMQDALRLAKMMRYKAALANLEHGGAKAVLMKPKQIKNRQAYFAKFADFINELGGRYITAVDSGTSPADMDIIRQYTAHVVCTTNQEKMGGGASAFTALSVRRGIEAAVKFKLGQDSLKGIHVAVQGAGNVGYYLAKQLASLGAQLTFCDVNPEKIQRIAQICDIQVVPPEKIYGLACDVFAPCALGGVLNAQTIPILKAPIIAGAANNQLATAEDGLLLHHRHILYAPDFVVNAGGLIYAAAMYNGHSENKIRHDTEAVYTTLEDIFTQAAECQQATSDLAEKLANAALEHVQC